MSQADQESMPEDEYRQRIRELIEADRDILDDLE